MVLVVVVNDVVDGGCVSIISSDVAMSRGVPGCVSRVSVVSGVAWVLKSTSAFVSSVESSDSIWRAALVCTASSSIPGTVWSHEMLAPFGQPCLS